MASAKLANAVNAPPFIVATSDGGMVVARPDTSGVLSFSQTTVAVPGPAGSTPYSIVADGFDPTLAKVDVLVGSVGGPDGGVISFFGGTGTGSGTVPNLSPPVQYPLLGSDPRLLLTADLNGDLLPDLVVADQSRRLTVHVTRNCPLFQVDGGGGASFPATP
jgi:hypothetical protein